jgi:hypothetical protein
MTDRELMQQGYEVPLVEQLDAVPRDARLWIEDSDGMGSRHFPIGLMCHKAAEALRAKLSAPEPEPVAKLFGTLPVYETKQDGILTVNAPPQRVYCSCGDGIVPDDGALCGTCVSLKDAVKQEPVAWVENLTDAQPHAVTDLKYCSVAQHERGEHLKYIPLYADPTPCQTCEALARTVMMDQTSHDTPPQREWRSLTQREQAECWYGKHCMEQSAPYEDFARAIEAKLREKNGNL